MVLMSDVEMPTRVINQQLSSAIRMVVQVSRLQDGSRKIVSIAEVRGIKDERVDVQDIFLFDRTGVTAEGKVQGRFRWSGHKPAILERFRVSGLHVSESIFDETIEVNM
jgi:pilus assembly protein CpaF